MEPNKFRESRQAINRKYKKIDALIDEKAVEESKTRFEKVSEELDALKPEAEGEIQERSVKNLGIKLNRLASRIKKLKTKRAAAGKSGGGAKTQMVWDETKLSELAAPFLKKIYANMEGDAEAKVLLGTTGKGIRPNYRIEFSDGRVAAFTGSGHKPQEITAGTRNLSQPFGIETVKAALDGKA